MGMFATGFMRILVILFSLGFFLSCADGAYTWSLCSSTEDYRVAVKNVTIKPDPIVRGHDARFEIPAVTTDTIEGGKVTIQVYYLGIHVYTEENDICVSSGCPIAPGEFSISSTEDLPSFTPPGSYRLDMHIQNLDGDLLTCLKINFRISAALDTLLSI